jgi:hypothetical protein
MYQQLWGYKVEEKLYLGVREQRTLNTTGLDFNPGPPEYEGVLTTRPRRSVETLEASNTKDR